MSVVAIACWLVEFLVAYIVLSIITYILVYGLDHSTPHTNRVSAYSVFNKGGKRLAGEFDPTQYDKFLRNGGTLSKTQ
jgi:hypothetical protein